MDSVSKASVIYADTVCKTFRCFKISTIFQHNTYISTRDNEKHFELNQSLNDPRGKYTTVK